MPPHPHRGLTLIEVLCSTLILVVCCLVIIGLLPAALKTQQMTRYRIYAAAATTTMCENVANMPTDFQDIVGRYGYNDYYAKLTNPGTAQPPTPGWATRIRHAAVLGSAFAPDFEQIVATVNNAAIPVPLEIANRLDSDGGEIAAHLRGGGALYYLNPALFRGYTLTAIRDASATANLPSEFHHLVFAVTSPAQQNTLPMQPFEPGPYTQPYPFPPQWQRWECTNRVGSSPGWTYTPVRTSSVSAARTPADPTQDPRSNQGTWSSANGGVRWINTAVGGSAFDATPPLGDYHGSSWKYLADQAVARGNTGSPWVKGWWAFKRLAGDEFAGWMPVHYMLEYSGSVPTYEQLANYRDRALFLWQQVMPASLAAGFPAPLLYTGTPGADVNGKLHKVVAGPYLRADVQAHGLEHYAALPAGTEFWSWTSDVDGSSPYALQEFRWVEPCYYGIDAQKTRLRDFRFADPYSLPVAEFPPHPAQVLALSYLAHAALLVAGAAETSGYTGYFADLNPNPGVTSAKVTDADRLFARTVGEMCLRWAVAYANERPNDWGAPRPANRQTMTDCPITMFDLWFDNTQRSTTAPFAPTVNASTYEVAIRRPRNLAAAGSWDKAVATPESFYRWIEPPNPSLGWIDPAQKQLGFVHGRNNAGPMYWSWHPTAAVNWLPTWKQFCEDATTLAGPGSPWPRWLGQPVPPGGSEPGGGTLAGGSDQKHWWIDRPFAPEHRARELVFWAVDWKSYQDAELAPSAPVDLTRAGRTIYNGNMVATPQTAHHAAARDKWDDSVTSAAARLAMFGNPEGDYAWTSATRNLTWGRTPNQEYASPWSKAPSGASYGAFGADRNNNGVLDQGPVPATTRLRALSVGRFTVYDPILRLHTGL